MLGVRAAVARCGANPVNRIQQVRVDRRMSMELLEDVSVYLDEARRKTLLA